MNRNALKCPRNGRRALSAMITLPRRKNQFAAVCTRFAMAMRKRVGCRPATRTAIFAQTVGKPAPAPCDFPSAIQNPQSKIQNP